MATMRLFVYLLFFSVCLGSPVGDSLREAVDYVGNEQSVGVRGQLKCGSAYLANTKVKLWDEDSGPGDPDDLIGEAETNSTGHFKVWGTQKELSSIDPRFNVYHQCNKKGTCKRKVTFTIPDKYINQGKKVNKWFDLGSLNMEIVTKGESVYCF